MRGTAPSSLFLLLLLALTTVRPQEASAGDSATAFRGRSAVYLDIAEPAEPSSPAEAPPDELDLLTWAATQSPNATGHAYPLHACDGDCFLVVGVKISALRGFRARQAIRATWGDAVHARRRAARLVFLGCEPDYAALNATDAQQQQLKQALALEKRFFGDLLTHELRGCVDSYFGLVEKTLGFFQWAAHHHASAAYTVVVDDDTYVRVDKLVVLLRDVRTPRQNYYAGQVWASQFGRPVRPIRLAHEKNFVPVAAYAMAEWPPFSSGPHYVLSSDLVQFLARNRDVLRGVGTLEDVSVAFWLLALRQIRPTHLPQFDNVRFKLCHNALVAYTNLSLDAMHAIHASVVRGRSFCHGFSFDAWAKTEQTQNELLPSLIGAQWGRTRQELRYAWATRIDWDSRLIQVVATISAATTSESLEAAYVPSRFTFVEVCAELLARAAREMPSTFIDRDFCGALRLHLLAFLREGVASQPAMGPFYALAQTNAPCGSTNAAIFTFLTARARRFRTLVETLMAAMYADAHVYVLDQREYDDRFGALAADFVFATADDEDAAAAPATRAALGSRAVTATTRRIVFAMGTKTAVRGAQAIRITDAVAAASTQDIHVPLASLSFADRTTHTPLDLLRPRDARPREDRAFAAYATTGLGVVSTTAAHVLASFLQDIRGVEVAELRTESDVADAQVLRYAQFRFAVVVEDRLGRPGALSAKLTAAFLGGCVPIYVGDSQAARALFNPRTFINCGDSALRACAQHVASVDQTPALYEAMRRAAPVVDVEAFYAAFSWHPQVVATLSSSIHSPSIVQRLQTLVENTSQ